MTDGAVGPESPSGEARSFESRFRARSYELDALAHVNHAVFLNWLEQARYQAMEEGGLPLSELAARGWSVVVARIEVDYVKEVCLGDEVTVRTRVEETRRTSMVLAQEVLLTRPGDDAVAARARVVAVWTRQGRPVRIPREVRAALGIA